jgi:hypothetical protein
MTDVVHLSMADLEAGLAQVRGSPRDRGVVELVVRRPALDQREILDEALLDAARGLVGDRWQPDRFDTQLTLMNARAASLVAVDPDRRALAGDQLYVDLDISEANLPAGTRLAVGTAVVQISDKPHTGCQKFAARFGRDALRFVNSPMGRQLRLRGVNTRIVADGVVRPGDVVRIL